MDLGGVIRFTYHNLFTYFKNMTHHLEGKSQ
ncbi:hypothetical protein DI53_0172 [Sphingobacterium deserti]|uniref:Uncharacterized protein n=1 Tax=Sphingobacterium deserti TaxID=1229276 RepID=A0A0B8T3E7_9SPHI|nr:hypothetical protein DI53_0172 [Sphingobacterium deserti]